MATRLSNKSRETDWAKVYSQSFISPQTPFEAANNQPPVCASYMREEKAQFRFLMAFQALVLALAVGTLLLLLVAIWQVIGGQAVAAIVSAAGTIVTGSAAGFLNTQRTDARDAFHAAQDGVKANCGS